MPDDIKLPPLPDYDPDLQGSEIAPGVYQRGHTDDAMQAYARAAVEADRAQRKPLTREQIAEACRPLYVSARAAEMALPGDIDTARAIEAAHNIPAPKGGSDA